MSGEVEGGGRTTKGNSGRRTEISFYSFLVIPFFVTFEDLLLKIRDKTVTKQNPEHPIIFVSYSFITYLLELAYQIIIALI